MTPSMHCSYCNHELRTLTHQPEMFRFCCPECGEVFLDYSDPTGMSPEEFKTHFGAVRKTQFKNLQRLFPHTRSKIFPNGQPKERAVSTLATELLFTMIYESLVKERFPSDVKNMAE